jgi:hypothetical protein
MTVKQDKLRGSPRLEIGYLRELERRISALEGLGQQTVRFGTKVRGVRQDATKSTDLARKAQLAIGGDIGDLVIIDSDGWLVGSGYTPNELMTEMEISASAISAYRSTAIQKIPDSMWTVVQFNAESYDLLGEFALDTNVWAEVAPQLGAETAIRSLCEFGGKLYGGTMSLGKLYEWDDVDEWTLKAGQLNAQTHILSLIEYNSKLYGGTGPNGRLFEWNESDAWAQKADQLGGSTYIRCMIVFDGALYGGTAGNGNLLAWNDADAWVQKAAQLGAETDIYSLCELDGELYGGTGPNGTLVKWNGVNAWTQVAPQFGAETVIYSLVVMNGEIYGSTGNLGKLLKWNGVNAWEEAAGQFMGQTQVYALATINDIIYGVTNPNGKMVLWNGTDAWIEKADQLGTQTAIYSLLRFNDKYYGGTSPNGKLYEWGGIDGKFAADNAGKYFIHATIGFTSTNIVANKTIIAAIYKNDSEIARQTIQSAYAEAISISVQTEEELTTGSFIEIYVWHDMGGTCEIDYGAENTHLEIRRVDNLSCGIGDTDQCIMIGHTHEEFDDYYTAAQLDAGQLNTIYFQESEFLNSSAGAADAGKPIILDAAGHVDATMINSADVDHDATTNFVGNEHIDHSGVSVIAGTLLTGGGAITASVTLNVDEASIDHGSIAGLTDDDHTQYLKLAGRAGGQTAIGGTGSGDDLTLQSTSHATKGSILFGTSAYDEVNNRLGLGVTTPATELEIRGTTPTITIGDGTYSHLIKHTNAEGVANKYDLRIGLDESQRALFIMDKGDIDVDFGTTMYSHPTLYICHSSTAGRMLMLQYNRIDFIGYTANQINFYPTLTLTAFNNHSIAGGAWKFLWANNKGLNSNSQNQYHLQMETDIRQSGTASYTAFYIDVTENSVGSGEHNIIDFNVGGARKFNVLNTGALGLGCTPSTMLEVEETEALTGNIADGYAGCITLDPGYTDAYTVTRHNYIDINDVSTAGGAAVTDAAVMRFDAAIGTHKAVLAAFQTTDSNGDTTDWAAGIQININGTLYKIPCIAV